MVELVEAATHLGRMDDAASAAKHVGELAQASGTDWALETAASLRAQISHEPAAEALYREAIDRLGRTEVHLQTARVYLLLGEWLRRHDRRADARSSLSTAHEMLSQFGAAAFAERARRELEATGARRPTPRTGSPSVARTLTHQEAQIAQLAANGLTNPEIGAQLFISAHTVEWHLRKVFTKLGVRSRRNIGASLADSGAG